MALASSRTSSGRLSCRVEDVERVAVRVGHHAMREGRARVQGRRARVVGGRRPLTRAVGIEVAVGPAHIDGAVRGECGCAPMGRQAGSALAVQLEAEEHPLLVTCGGHFAPRLDLIPPLRVARPGVEGHNGGAEVWQAQVPALELAHAHGLFVQGYCVSPVALPHSVVESRKPEEGTGRNHHGAVRRHRGPRIAGILEFTLPQDAAVPEPELAQDTLLALLSTG
mmetsp:Transcript_8234/g.25617  ORF Transcript_8234/g.25617 Transcript_8234/m.25617 type:complete len:224 (-) Transcript_8234:808-1479(-)